MPGERPPVHERQPFCVQCGLVDKIDHDDGACGYCGGDTCGLDQLRTLLAAHDLHVVSPADVDRVHTVANEAFGPFPVQALDDSVTEIERGIFALRMRIQELERGQISAADKAVLDATINSMREFPDSDLAGLHEDDMCGLYKAELARRAATEKG